MNDVILAPKWISRASTHHSSYYSFHITTAKWQNLKEKYLLFQWFLQVSHSHSCKSNFVPFQKSIWRILSNTLESVCKQCFKLRKSFFQYSKEFHATCLIKIDWLISKDPPSSMSCSSLSNIQENLKFAK